MGDVPSHTKSRTFYNSHGHLEKAKVSHSKNDRNKNDRAETKPSSCYKNESNLDNGFNQDCKDIDNLEMSRVKRRSIPGGDMQSPSQLKCGGESCSEDNGDEQRREMYANPQGDGGILASGHQAGISYNDKPHQSAKRVRQWL